MPKAVYIFLLFVVASCRVVAMVAPLVEQSSHALVVWHDQECNSEDNDVEKAKQENKEDAWLGQMLLGAHAVSSSEFDVFLDNNLLDHTLQPVNPPPNSPDFFDQFKYNIFSL